MESPGVNKPVEEVESWADQRRTRVLWGADRLVERLIELADSCQVFYPPTAEEIVEEAGLVMPRLESPALNPETCLGPRSLAGKPLAGFRATPSRRIPVLYGMVVYAIRFKNQLLHL